MTNLINGHFKSKISIERLLEREYIPQENEESKIAESKVIDLFLERVKKRLEDI